MDIAQYFDTTITDCDSGLSTRLIVVPNASLAPHARQGLLDWAQLLGLRTTARLQTEAEIVAVLASLLRPADTAAREFARAVATEPRMPFGEAGPQPVSLMTIARSAGDDLAAAASLVSMVDWRLLLVGVPSGLVLAGSALSVSAALDRGLSDKIREAMGLDGREYRITGPGPIRA